MLVPMVGTCWSPYNIPAKMKSSSVLLVGFTALLSWEGDAIRAGGDAVPQDVRAGPTLKE